MPQQPLSSVVTLPPVRRFNNALLVASPQSAFWWQ